MNDSIILRPIVRETMQAAPGRKWTAQAIHRFLSAAGYPGITEDDVAAALTWNERKRFVIMQPNGETTQEEWTLTDKGRAAQ